MQWLGVDLSDLVISRPILHDQIKWDGVVDKHSTIRLHNANNSFSRLSSTTLLDKHWRERPITVDGRTMYATDIQVSAGAAVVTVQNVMHKYYKNTVDYTVTPTNQTNIGVIIEGLLTSAGVPAEVIDTPSLEAVKIFFSFNNALFNCYFPRSYGIKLVDALNTCLRAGSIGTYCDDKLRFILPIPGRVLQQVRFVDMLESPKQAGVTFNTVYKHYLLGYQFDAGTPATNSVALLADVPDYSEVWMESFDFTNNLQMYNKHTADFCGLLKVTRDGGDKSSISFVAHAGVVQAEMGGTYEILHPDGGLMQCRLMGRHLRGNIKTLTMEEIL